MPPPLDPTLVYDPNNVVRELMRNDINFCMAGMTRNQCATGTGADSTGADGRVVETWRLGLLAGYSHSRLDADARASSGSSDNYHLGLYGGRQWGAARPAFRQRLHLAYVSLHVDGFTEQGGAVGDSTTDATFTAHLGRRP